MPQETNLNVSPYFDDFDANKDYYKVLFKPGYPIQARELTTLQSILQNQVEQFGNNIFKEGSIVIPGQPSIDIPFPAVEIEPTFNGAPISLYFDQLLGTTLRGATSGVSARVIYLLKNTESDRGNYTLYLQYLESGGADFNNKVFSDSETLIAEKEVSYGNFTIPVGQGICNTIATNATSNGSSVNVASGVYFIRGIFLRVSDQRIILDQYGVNPSYRVGFNVIESVVTSDEDNSLFDNAQGFSNYAAPGADRFKISAELTKKEIDEEADNFVEILRVLNGVPQFVNKNPQYSIIRDELARRTADSNGDFYVKPFTLFVQDSLNDRVLTNGIYLEGQNTVNGNTPSEDKMVYQIGPGKAYVNGYDVESIAPKLLDIDKPRTTKTLNSQVIPYNAGNLFIVNNSYGSASIGLGTTSYVSLMDSRIGNTAFVATGTTIGVARVYDFIPESNYVNDTSNAFLRLYDIQTFTTVGLTTAITQSLPAFIQGKKSNASGYLRTAVTGSSSLTLYQVSGKFLENEAITINGIDNGRLIRSVRDYSISDIKSIYSQVGVSTFNADLVLESRNALAPQGTIFSISAAVGGISTVSAGLGTNFVNKITSGDIISYPNPNLGFDVVYNRVNSVSAGGTNFTISALSTVSGICSGNLPTSAITVTNIVKLSALSYGQDTSLLTRLNRENVSSVELEDNEIVQRRLFSNVSFSGNSITVTIPASDADIFFDSFDEDKFVITYNDGTIEPLRRDKYNINITGKILTFNGLTKAGGVGQVADVITTVRNLKPNSKIKKLNKANTLVVSNSKLTSSGIGTTTLNDGLTFSQVYGTRVQDNEISLNVPDVLNVLAVYESSGISDPSLPNLKLTSFTGPTNNNQDYVIGEQIIGQTSGAVGLVVNRVSTDTIEYVYLNLNQFVEGEVVRGKDSTTQALVTEKGLGDKNVTQNFSLDNGQRDQYYDYGRIIRRRNVVEPTKKLKVVFQNYTIDSSDTGEFITANSYLNSNFKTEVPLYRGRRVSDFIDIRPRVAPYTSSTKSPFEFESRIFTNSGQYSLYTLAPDENIVLNYSFYVGRVDKVFLNQDGKFEVVSGEPDEIPRPPVVKDNALQIASVTLPPYLYNPKNAIVNMQQHKRYQMSDISLLEDRIQRVEEFTTLTSLESKTENFTIKDAETGLDRFKCGFFVDDFKTHLYHDLQNPSFKSCIDKDLKMLRPLHYTTSLDLQLGSEAISGVGQTFSPNKDQSYVTDLGSPGVRKTGDLITLDYTEVKYDEQLLATKTESVTAFLVRFWSGFLQLNPPIDTWIDEKAITTTSFNEIKTTVDPLPDQNITIVNNVTDNKVVFTNPPIAQNGDQPFDWLGNARNAITNITTKGNVGFGPQQSTNVTIIGKGGWANPGQEARSIEIVNGGTIRINGLHWTRGDKELLERYVPADVAEQFLTRMINARGGGGNGLGGFLDFTPGRVEERRQTTTTLNSTSNTVTTFTPERVIEKDTTSQSLSNYTEPVRYLRSRNIEFDARALKPRTRFYSFFQGIDVKDYIIPKLLEIEMISGKFQIGETVESDPNFASAKIRFRLCKPNHKTGPFDGSNPPLITNPVPITDFATGQVLPQNPEALPKPDIFTLNPYNQQPVPDDYSESSTFLNVDTRALQLLSETNYYGQIAPNMRLIGKTSGAVARISNIRLLSDNNGRLLGSLFIPDPNVVGNPKWINGENTFTVIDTEKLENIKLTEFIANSRINESTAEAEFTSSGIVNVAETNILTTRNITIIPPSRINTTTITNTTTNTTTVTQVATPGSTSISQPYDPLAQSFYVFEDTGVFLTSVDIWFETKDPDNMPVTLQIRPLVAGVPSNIVVPFSEVTLTPDQINLSVDGTIPTKFTFPSPVFLSGPRQQTVRQAPIASQTQAEYAIVLVSNSPNYRVFVTELGQNDILSGVKVSRQPTLGSLFKSQNGTVWSPAQLEDLKYRVNRANFVNEGLVRFYNPKLSLGNKKVTVTGPNQIQTISKRIVVGLGSTGYDSAIITPGVTITQESATSTLIGIGGSITIGTGVTIVSAGVGYTPTIGTSTYSNIDLTTETGYGQGAKASIIVSNGSIGSVSITSGGMGYQVGDSLLIPNIGQNVGFGGRVVVSTISSRNTFVLDGVQGTFSAGINTISYVNSAGVTTYVGAGVTISSITQDQYYTGTHLKIYQQNHGMHSSENYVRISEMRPTNSEVNSRSTAEITSSEVNSISVVSGVGFTNFEGVAVSASNPGYVIIGNEVIAYTGVSGNSLTTLTRAVDGTQAISYDSGVYVYKYEFNGVSLRRINKVHNFAEVDTTTHPIDLDSYHVKIDMDSTDFEGTGIGSDRSNGLYFNSSIQTGDSGTVITNNIQYESITPNIANIIPAKTNITAKIRTFTGTSIGGNEKSFVDSGFETIPLAETTYFNEPKIICSDINEERFVNESPGNRSLTMEFFMSSSDPRVSPVIDTIRTSVLTTSNLINNPVGIQTASLYADDDSVRSLFYDKHNAIYISKPVRLKLPANSLKVLLTASRNDVNDVRVLYRIFRDDAPDSSQNYELFPGYSNYRVDGIGIKRVIDSSRNDGSADSFVTESSDRSFKSYEYSVDDLPEFNAFSIKIVMASSNQATPPMLSDLRAIATVKPNN
jgi:hypothetical protein